MSNPDDAIDISYREKMNDLAAFLDKLLNGDERSVAFVLLVTEFDNMEGRVNYISNGKRADIARAERSHGALRGPARQRVPHQTPPPLAAAETDQP